MKSLCSWDTVRAEPPFVFFFTEEKRTPKWSKQKKGFASRVFEGRPAFTNIEWNEKIFAQQICLTV